MAIQVAEGGTRKSGGAKPDINVTPLIDVLLVLLIIFMVITPLKPHKLESKIPERVETPPDQVIKNPFVIVVSLEVSPTGTISGIKLNADDVTEEDLSKRLRDHLDTMPPDRKTVFIRAARNAYYGEVIRIIDIVKNAGGSPIGLQIDDLPEK